MATRGRAVEVNPLQFDLVIVGAGTAASVIAYRLGEAGKKICMLEAGKNDSSMMFRVPAGFIKLIHDPDFTFQFHHEGSPGTEGRRIHAPQGRVAGGSSSINGMVYNRGLASSYDSWAQAGNKGWSFQDVLPLFQRSERALHVGSDEFRGRSGRLPVNLCGWRNEVCEAFISGAVELGIPRGADYNGSDQAGTGFYQNAIHRNERWSAARAFLHPAQKRFDVDLRTECHVTQIVMDGKRAVGVRYRRPDGSSGEVRAREAVVVSAGTANTAKLLQLSGIGPASLLRDKGIDVRNALSGVGENFRDHFSPRIVARAKPGTDSINTRIRGLPFVREAMRWVLNRPSVAAVSPMQAYAYWKTDPSLEDPDFAMSFAPASYKAGMLGKLDELPGMTVGTKQLRPQSSGHVRIRSADYRDPPELQPNFIKSEIDQRVIVSALKWARAVLNSAPLQPFVQEETFPGRSVRSDDEWLAFARENAQCGYHLIGTAKMGPKSDPMSVVDHRLRVHGIDRLIVADCSIMPSMPSGNTCAAAMMVGEKCAEMYLEKAGCH